MRVTKSQWWKQFGAFHLLLVTSILVFFVYWSDFSAIFLAFSWGLEPAQIVLSTSVLHAKGKHFSMTSGLGADFCCGKFTKRSLWRCEKRCPKKHPMPSGQISSRPHTTDFPQMVVNSKGNPLLGGGFKYFLFSPRSLGIHDPIWLAHIFFFKWGWWNTTN